MEAEFIDIQRVFADNNLRLPTLRALVPDTHFYQALAIQPTGEITARHDFIGNADRLVAISKFSDFMRLAVENACELVLSPEYSCPWEVLGNAIEQQNLPQSGKLWMLGCESITPAELNGMKAAHRNVEWIHEPIPAGNGGFLDVLAYLTKAEAIQGGTKDVIILQFKTQAMGGNTFERDHLLCGRRIYVWHNPVDNIRLISLICSEALLFDQADTNELRFDLHPYVIFHPQLVPNPRHIGISAYRSRLFGHVVGERVEVLTLNWARGFTLPGELPNRCGGSAIYTKSPQFVTSDARLNANHTKGLFYTYWHAQRTELCLFSFDEHVFHYRMPKTFQNVQAVLAQRTGPEMLFLKHWDAPTEAWQNSAYANDGFAQLCEIFQEPACDFCQNAPNTMLNRERLLTLSAGKLRRTRDWHHVRNMDSFTAETDERSKRLTFTHEQAPDSNNFRHNHLARYITLQMNVLTDPTNFPPTIQDLRNNWRLHPPGTEDDFRFNLVSQNGQTQGATAIFVDLEPPDFVHQLKNDLIRTWGKIETRRLVIWYRYQNTIRCMHPAPPSITDDLELPASIAGSANL
jgi:hypothetical protein